MRIPQSISDMLWLLGPAGNLVVLALLLRRRLAREFPIFFSYLAFHVIEAFVTLLIYSHFGRKSWAYLYAYWMVQAIGLSLRFGVIYEIFCHVLRPYEGLRRGGTVVFRWLAVLLAFAAIGIAVLGPSNEPNFAISGALIIQRSIDVMQCGLLILLFLFASYFALTWRNYVFGIALGFGLIASVELLAAALATQSSEVSSALLLNSLPRIAFDLAGLVWIIYLALPEPSRVELKALPQHDLEKWNDELLELLQR
jgi:hypothetical protein